MSFQTTVTLTGGASITNVSLTGCTDSSCTSGTAIVDNTNVPISGFVSGKIITIEDDEVRYILVRPIGVCSVEPEIIEITGFPTPTSTPTPTPTPTPTITPSEPEPTPTPTETPPEPEPTPTPTETPPEPEPTPTPTETPPEPEPTPTPTITPTEPEPEPTPTGEEIYTHGAVRVTCSDFCTDNYLIGTLGSASDSYSTLTNGGYIYGYSGESGYIAYSNVETNTTTGPFRIAEIDTSGLILGIFECSVGSCVSIDSIDPI
jgi:hypothetical protein